MPDNVGSQAPSNKDWKKTESGKKVFVRVAGKTNGAHHELFNWIIQSGHVEVEDHHTCDYILVFCPVESRVGTDVDKALENLPADKRTVLVVMHYTYDPSAVIADSSRLVNNSNVFTVDCLFYEGKLLTCDLNKQTWQKIQSYLGIQDSCSSLSSGLLAIATWLLNLFWSPPPPPPPLFDEPWRKIDWGQRQDDLDYVKNFTPENEAQQIRVLLYGPAGAGKSSFTNSVQTVLHGVDKQALEAATGGSFTKAYKTFKIPKGTPGGFYPFVFTDIMGLEPHGGVHVEDIKLALKGHVKDGYKFNPVSRLSEGDQFYNQDPTTNDKVHILVCVIPADTLFIIKDETLQKIRDIRKEARGLNIVQMIMITKIDQLCPETKDLRNVYRSKLLKEKMEQISADVGIPMNCIFPVKNYHEEIQLNDDADSLILSALRNIIDAGDEA